MRREREAYEDALAIIRQFNARLSAKKPSWFWPTIAAALASKHHWLIIACDACNTVIDLDLTVKRRDPDAPVRVALNDVRCPRFGANMLQGDITAMQEEIYLNTSTVANGSADHGRKRFNVNFVFCPGWTSTSR